MNPRSTKPPDILVLGGGGVLGEAWMSALLAGWAGAGGFDARECGGFIGTSAGSIVAASLAAGVDPASHLGSLPARSSVAESAREGAGGGPIDRILRVGGAAAGLVAAPVASVSLKAVSPGGALVRRAGLGRVPRGRRSLTDLGRMVERSGVGWDGRLRIAVVELESGRRLMLDGSGAPRATVSEAVQASCAIPGVFRPIELDGRSYVDGGAWSPTNLDTARVRRGTRVLCLNPTGSLRSTAGLSLGAIGPISRGVAAVEALALRRRGARVTTVNPDEACAAAMGTNLMDPQGRERVIAAGVRQGRELGSRS
jgi:NTE family protein